MCDATEILQWIIDEEPIGIVTLSNKTGHPHHKVRYSLRILEENNLVRPTQNGAVTTENTAEFIQNHQGEIDRIVDQIENMKISN